MTQSQTAAYKAALKEARGSFDRSTKRLAEISAEASILNDEISRLRRTITALAALCSESPGFDDLGITESCMEVMESERATVTTNQVVEALESMGFDLESQKNPQASVHAVLSRLALKGKIKRITEEQSKVVFWRGPNYDPKADEMPF